MASSRRKLHRIEGQNHRRSLTCSCYHRLPLFKNDDIKGAFVEHLRFVQQTLAFDVYAWVLMPEHFHLLIQPATQEQTVTQILRRLKASFARRVLIRWRELHAPILDRITTDDGAVRFWQTGGGYDRNIFNNTATVKQINYLHANPVRREIVKCETDYRWSSALFYSGQGQYQGPTIAPVR